MNKTIRAIVLALSLACLLLLAGCAKKSSEVVKVPSASPQAAASAPSEPAQAAAPSVSLEEQRAILEANRSLWEFTEPWESPWFYSFTDLDHNGRQEVIAASTQGTGIFTYAHFYEVKPDFSGIENVYRSDPALEGPDDWPEIVTDALSFYYDEAADRYWYVCEGVTRDGVAHQYYAWYALCLKDGSARWERLAEKNVEWDENGAEHTECFDAEGKPISWTDYDRAVEDRFAGLEKRALRLEWTQVDIPFDETQPSVPDEPAQPETPPAPAAPVDPGVRVTKNPSSEAIAIGGRTWFIAHADNGAAPTWLLQSPDGRLYTLDEAMAANPGLTLEALPEDTIAVGNVPLSLNGWGVIARFNGPGGYVDTEPAFLFVGDYVNAYRSVIDGYRAAYANGRQDDIGYLFDNHLSEMAAYSAGVGYALKDLDKNGVPELLIAGISPVYPEYDKAIYDVYTLDGGVPTQVAVSMARKRYALRTDGSLFWEGAGGASYVYFVVERVKGKTVEQTETLFTDLTADGQIAWYSRMGGLEDASPSNSTALTEAQFQSRVSELESTIYLPPLTKIA